MRYLTFIFLVFLNVFLSCNNGTKDPSEYYLRDSVTTKHLNGLDSSYYADTTDLNYKVLKAYLVNDTSFFKKLSIDIENEQKTIQRDETNDSCIHQPIMLRDLNADEAYRFVFTSAFCEYKLNVTISKHGSNANIHFVILQDVWFTPNATCKIINEYDKSITVQDWNDFSELMNKADFWGLKSKNGKTGLDGSTLVTTGFVKDSYRFNGKPRSSYVYRWGLSTLDEPFFFVLKLSGNKQGCVVVK